MKKEERDQFLLNRRICLWLCRDILPFSTIENIGFKDFWQATSGRDTHLPSRSTMSREALDDVYICMKKRLIDNLKEAPKHGVIAFDAWTDRFRKHSYCTFTYHYMYEWSMKSIILKTSRFDHPHTGESLKNFFQSTVNEYSLHGKNLLGISDGGSNVIKCLELLHIQRLGCMAHSCNRLIVHDLMKNEKMSPFEEILDKLRKSQRKLTFKYTELKEKAENDQQTKLFLMLEELCNIYEISKKEEQFVDDVDFLQLELEFSNALEDTHNNFRGLHSSNPVRWNCLHNTIECHIRHQSK